MSAMAEDNDSGRESDTLQLLLKWRREGCRFDNKGDIWYDLISAVHKSIRGLILDAALYWSARMIAAGYDPLYIGKAFIGDCF